MILWAFLSFIVSFLLLPVAGKLALSYNFTDKPDKQRKCHQCAVPPIGGLVIIPVFMVMSVLSGLSIQEHIYFIVALGLVWAIGGLDDKYYLSAGVRLSVQFFAALLLVIGNLTEIYYLGDLFGFGDIQTHPFSVLFSVLCIVLVINAINMIDGLNGLCGGVLAIMLMALACASMMAGGHEMVTPIFILLGALSGFLFYNYRYKSFDKNCLFMGDSGSTSLGLILSWMMIELTQNTTGAGLGLLEPALMAWIIALPVFDALWMFAYRLFHGQSPLQADRHHIHYLMCDQGISEKNSVNVIHYITLFYAAFGVVTISLLDVPAAYLMPLWLACFFMHGWAVFSQSVKIPLRKILNTY